MYWDSTVCLRKTFFFEQIDLLCSLIYARFKKVKLGSELNFFVEYPDFNIFKVH